MEKENQKPAKAIGLRMVIYWVSVVLIGLIIPVFSAVVTIQASQFFIGILFFIPAIFIFIPQKYLRITRTLKVTIFVIAYFTLVVISGLNAPAPAAPEKQLEHYSLGEKLNLNFGNNNFSMVVRDVSAETRMILDGKEISTSGFYLFVNGEVKNLGKSPLNLSFLSELKDDQDNLYGLIAVRFEKAPLQPNVERKFSNIFEIPKDAQGLKFIVKDDTDTVKVVNLGR